jgi:hypothetical protein
MPKQNAASDTLPQDCTTDRAGTSACIAVVEFFVGAIMFTLAYGQFPLYDGNYATYLAHAFGPRGDWLVETVDPFPLFTALAKLGAPWTAYVWHALLLGVYVASLRRIFAPRSWLFPALLVLAHSQLFRAGVRAASGGDWAWYLQSGVAMQYVLGFVFQPSLFGVLLVASLAAFLDGRGRLAVVLAAAAAWFHASYALPCVVLTALYGWRDRRLWALSATLLVPLAALVIWRFGGGDPRAQALLVETRIPHHTLVRRWLHSSLWLQGALVAAGIAVARRTRGPMVAILAVGATLTLVQVATGSRGLALAFPWRVSVILVPLSTAAILSRIPERRGIAVVAGGLAAVAAAYGLRWTLRGAQDYHAAPETGLLAHVRATRRDADLYEIPTALSRFRLDAQARTFVDWKSHPYRASEVLEWWARIQAARAVEQGDCGAVEELRRRWSVTHFVVERPLDCAGLSLTWSDAHYRIYHVPAECGVSESALADSSNPYGRQNRPAPDRLLDCVGITERGPFETVGSH